MRFFEIKAVTNIDKGEEIYIPASDHKKATYETKIKGYEIYRAKSKLGPMPLEHFLVKDSESDGFLGELKLTGFDKYWTSDIFFDPQIQGKGLALPLYAYVVKKGYTLVSDREQSKGSQTIWKKLTQLPGIFVYAWDRHTDEFFQWNPEEELDDAIYKDKNDIRLVAIADKQETNENFADGKTDSKSRPGRVKRAGASCNGSVTSLRKKAKNASGEKAKMYHWCANMKSGRNK